MARRRTVKKKMGQGRMDELEYIIMAKAVAQNRVGWTNRVMVLCFFWYREK